MGIGNSLGLKSGRGRGEARLGWEIGFGGGHLAMTVLDQAMQRLPNPDSIVVYLTSADSAPWAYLIGGIPPSVLRAIRMLQREPSMLEDRSLAP